MVVIITQRIQKEQRRTIVIVRSESIGICFFFHDCSRQRFCFPSGRNIYIHMASTSILLDRTNYSHLRTCYCTYVFTKTQFFWGGKLPTLAIFWHVTYRQCVMVINYPYLRLVTTKINTQLSHLPDRQEHRQTYLTLRMMTMAYVLILLICSHQEFLIAVFSGTLYKEEKLISEMQISASYNDSTSTSNNREILP